MDTKELLLRAILLQPKEDTTRLVYADYLEEEGDATRAEFIRVQVELARFEPPPVITCGAVISESIGLDGPNLVTAGVNSSDLKDAYLIAQRVDLKVLSTLNPQHYLDYELDSTEVSMQDTPVIATFRKSQLGPWPQRKEYNQLLKRQYQLIAHMNDSKEPGWVRWGCQLRPGKSEWCRWIGPSTSDQFPDCEIPPHANQRFKRGFVHHINLYWETFRNNIKEIFSSQPVQSVVIRDISLVRPINITDEAYLDVYANLDSTLVYLYAFQGERLHQQLPEELMRFMPKPITLRPGMKGWEFKNADEGHKTISKACIAYGREAAGL